MENKKEVIDITIQWFEWFLCKPGSDAEPIYTSEQVLTLLRRIREE